MKYSIIYALLSVAWSAACGAADPGAVAAGSGHDNANLPPGDVNRGKALANQSSCASCHGADYAGSGFNPNLTPSAAGLGTWTDAQIASAIRDGSHEDGEQLCSLMERFPFSDQETADVIAFLHSIPPSSKPTTATCPGHGG